MSTRNTYKNIKIGQIYKFLSTGSTWEILEINIKKGTCNIVCIEKRHSLNEQYPLWALEDNERWALLKESRQDPIDELETLLTKRDDENIPCLTPSAVYSTTISKSNVCVSVNLPFDLALDEHAAKRLEHQLHRAVEAILAQYFTE